MAISIKDDEAIRNITIAGNIIYEIFKKIEATSLIGMRTIELNDQIENLIRKHNATPAFLGYRGFPKSVCISLNDEVVHGIPDDRQIEDGALVKIDIGVQYQGYIADAARTFGVGAISAQAQRLLSQTKQALKKGIAAAKGGNRVSDISKSVQRYVEGQGFSVVRELTGHGVGYELHEEPMIPNFLCNGPDPILAPGMVLAIEPMVNAGGYEVVTSANGWTICTRDGSLSAHFEDTIVVLKKGNLNFTRVAES